MTRSLTRSFLCALPLSLPWSPARLLPGGLVLAVALGTMSAPALADSGARQVVLEAITAEAKAENASFTGFSAERGERLFRDTHGGGKPETPRCTACHDPDPRQAGQTRAGKIIDPLAPSVVPDRFTDPAKVEKWFRRNCSSVLGRPCSPQEKGDFLTYMIAK